MTFTYVHTYGVHQLLTRNINAPLPGTYTGPGTGVRPLGGNENIYEYSTEGVFKQDQLITSANIRMSTKLTLSTYYVVGWANSNTGTGFPVDQYSLANEYGRAPFDVRQRLFLLSNFTTKWGLRFSPIVTISSSTPFNITLGQDLNGDSIFNDRPAFATDLSRASVVRTKWGAFDTAPLPGQTIIPVNYGQGYGRVGFDLRVSKTVGFGPTLGETRQGGEGRGRGGPGGGGPGGGDHGHGPGGGMVRMGGGGGPFGGGGGTGKRYNLTFSVNANNILNYVNPAAPVGNLSSPLFGTSNALAGGFGGFGGGGSAPANRRIWLQVQFGF